MKLKLLAAFALALCTALHADKLNTADAQTRVDTKVIEIQRWAADPMIVAAVTAQNASLPTDYAEMTQEKWKGLSILDLFVRSFTKNNAGLKLKERKTEWVGEAFLSDARGLKVAFLSKPTNWSHAGLPKHDVPMAGEVWQGKIEVDESSGAQQLQVAVPVLADGKPIGSLVVGIFVSKI